MHFNGHLKSNHLNAKILNDYLPKIIIFINITVKFMQSFLGNVMGEYDTKARNSKFSQQICWQCSICLYENTIFIKSFSTELYFVIGVKHEFVS